jgi:hypothetical protein
MDSPHLGSSSVILRVVPLLQIRVYLEEKEDEGELRGKCLEEHRERGLNLA